MQIIIMRHGDALPMGSNDKERSLSALGEKQARQAGRWLNQYYHANGGIEFALVSPYTRAQQTFKQLATQVQIANKTLCEDIVPEGNAALVHDYIDFLIPQNKIEHNLLIVSHMPFVSYLCDELCGLQESILFATSSCAIIEYAPKSSCGRLLEVYYPHH